MKPMKKMLNSINRAATSLETATKTLADAVSAKSTSAPVSGKRVMAINAQKPNFITGRVHLRHAEQFQREIPNDSNSVIPLEDNSPCATDTKDMRKLRKRLQSAQSTIKNQKNKIHYLEQDKHMQQASQSNSNTNFGDDPGYHNGNR